MSHALIHLVGLVHTLDSKRSELLIQRLCGTALRIQRDLSETHCTVAGVSDFEELLGQCFSQHAITSVSKPSLCVSPQLTSSVSSDPSMPPLSLPHLFPLCTPHSIVHSVEPLSFLVSPAQRIPLKCYYLISLGVSEIQIHDTCSSLLFSISENSFCFSLLPLKGPRLFALMFWFCGIMRVSLDVCLIACRFVKFKDWLHRWIHELTTI